MFTEYEVITSVCDFLKAHNFCINQQLKENEKGDDIIAINQKNQKIYIEVKGQTSSKKGTNRYGKGFNSSQILTHISRALYRAISMKEKYSSHVGIALPETNDHVLRIQNIHNTLQEIKIEVFWVKADGTVRVENYSELF